MAFAISEHFGEGDLARAMDSGSVIVALDQVRSQPELMVDFIAELFGDGFGVTLEKSG